MIIFSHKFGQLGNRLFAFAHLIGNCAEHNTKIINLAFDEYAQYFEGSRQTFCRYPQSGQVGSNRCRSLFFVLNKITLKLLRWSGFSSSFSHEIIVADLPGYQFDKGVFFSLEDENFQNQVRRKPIIFLFGRFFRDYKNFEKHQETIRSYFTPIQDVQKEIDKHFQKSSSDVVIGVHIRRGDYAMYKMGKYFYSPEQYAAKMEQIVNSQPRSKRINFIICSNEKIDRSAFDGFNFQEAPGHPVLDMYLLAKCDYIMGPPSTFSAWSSFYGNKPLLQITDINAPLRLENFSHLPPQILYNF